MLFSDLITLKTQLEIDPEDHSEDAKLLLLQEVASGWMETELNRKFVKRERTEFPYKGLGTQKLLLNARPILTNPLPLVYVDEQANWGSSSTDFTDQGDQWVYGTDFCVRLDWDSQDSGVQDSSKSGILIAIRNLWPLAYFRYGGQPTSLLSPYRGMAQGGTVKVVYTAGYTVDQLPSEIRQACVLLIGKMRHLLPLGLELGGEGYEERSISIVHSQRTYLMSLVWPFIRAYRNWSW